jgi:putative transposase
MPDDLRRPFTVRQKVRLPDDAYSLPGSAFLLTIRARHGTRPFDLPERATRVIEILAEQRSKCGCWVGAYCVMPDHVHFVCGPSTEGASVMTLVERFKGASTNAAWKTGWKRPLWQQRCHDRHLEDEEAVRAAGEYVLNNPVRAGLVEAPDLWMWSGVVDQEES